jgi:hypothetical protein
MCLGRLGLGSKDMEQEAVFSRGRDRVVALRNAS